MRKTHKDIALNSLCLGVVVAVLIQSALHGFFGIKHGSVVGLPLGVLCGLFFFYKWKKQL